MSLDQTIVERIRQPIGSAFDGNLMIFDPDTGDTFTLNESAAAIWDCLAAPTSISAICTALCARYAVDEAECLKAVVAAVAELERYKMVRTSPNALLCKG